MPNKTILLSNKDISKCLSSKDILAAVEEVFRGQAEGQIIIPPKLHMDMSLLKRDSWMNAMPAYLHYLDTAGLKWVGGFAGNPSRGLPYIKGLIVLLDPENGEFLAVVDGTDITNLRTGASAALAAKYTARPGARSVALIGAGMQNRCTLRFLSLVFDELEVWVSDIDQKAAQAFKTEMDRELDWPLHIAANNQEAVERADVIVTATQADEPLVRHEWSKPGVAAVSLGSGQEFDESFILEADKILVDDWQQCSHRGELKKLAEAGRINQENIYTELKEVAAGSKPGRTNPDERILTQLVGLGAHDIAVATLAYRRAREKGLGSEFCFFEI